MSEPEAGRPLDDVQLDAKLRARLEEALPRLTALNEFLHVNVELAYEEFLSSAEIVRVLRESGFDVEEHLAGLPTAFRASIGSRDGVAVAFLCEYDGLPPYGQSCGHNVVSTASVAAAIAVAPLAAEAGLRVEVIGTPAEEKGGSKYALADAGVFEGLSAAMLIYPGMYDIADSRTLCAQALQVELHGRAAHASAHPELGINALDALLAGLGLIDRLRPTLHPQSRVHVMIESAGRYPQIVPDYANAKIMLRAPNMALLEDARARVEKCFLAAANSFGAELVVTAVGRAADTVRSSGPLVEVFAEALSRTGRAVAETDQVTGAWSTDSGYLSRLVPFIQPQVQITLDTVSPHSHEFHDASSGDSAMRGVVDAGFAFARTAYRFAVDPDLRARVRSDFEAAQRSIAVRERIAEFHRGWVA